MSLVIGLTGGIATGKSNVSQYLASQNYKVVDADQVTHTIQAKGTPGLKAIVKAFGHQFLKSDRTLNRRRLGELVFNRPLELKRLVRVIDPFIRRRIIAQLRFYKARRAPQIVLDAPTLFESGYQYLADRVVTVACSPRIQLRRLIHRDHLSINEAVARIGSQWPLTIKEALSDVVINSNGTVDQTRGQVIKLMQDRRL